MTVDTPAVSSSSSPWPSPRLGAACAKKPQAHPTTSILKTFADPPAEYRSAPLWVWNDRMTREEIKRQLEDFKARGIGGAFIHPRPGLITPYLTDEWFSLCAYAVEDGKAARPEDLDLRREFLSLRASPAATCPRPCPMPPGPG